MHLKLLSIRLREQEYELNFLIHVVSYRIPVPVTQVVRYPMRGYCYPRCPRCKSSMEREYVSFCDRCGQRLSWSRIEKAQVLTAPIIEENNCHRFTFPYIDKYTETKEMEKWTAND